jgi:outer membrane lipoprotein SlyB
VSMVVFAVVGAVLGHIAQSTVDESVRRKIEQELAVRADAA